MNHAMYGITGSSDKPAYRPKSLRYFIGFGARDSPIGFGTFPTIFQFSLVTECSGLFLLQGFCLAMHDYANRKSETASVFGFELPNYHFYTMHSSHWANGQRTLTNGPRYSVLAANYHYSEVISDKLDIHKTLNFGMSFFIEFG